MAMVRGGLITPIGQKEAHAAGRHGMQGEDLCEEIMPMKSEGFLVARWVDISQGMKRDGGRTTTLTPSPEGLQ